MRAFRVVVFPAFFDQDLGFSQALEDFAVQELIPEACIESLAVPVFPRRPWFDVSRLCADSLDAVPDSLSNKLRSIARRE